ncbi:Protein GLUTAMINE DUMPER 6 [Hirschfeldia incana]|nr:Protein GLUTAMINE DUMPER 6 [Hirschfeldia incana]
MRATQNVELWKSPIPYLFGGLSLVLLLIALALFSLVCIHKKSHSSSSNTYPDEEEEDVGDNEAKTVMGEYLPKIVVILAGDDQPTCLAVPVIPTLPSIYPCNCGNVTVVST